MTEDELLVLIFIAILIAFVIALAIKEYFEYKQLKKSLEYKQLKLRFDKEFLELRHYKDLTEGLYATDRPDLLEDPNNLLFKISP